MTVIREKANDPVTCGGCGLTPHIAWSATVVALYKIIPFLFSLVSRDRRGARWGTNPLPLT